MNRPEKWFDRWIDCARCEEYESMHIQGHYHHDTQELVITPVWPCRKCGARDSGLSCPSRLKAVSKEAKP